MFENAPEAYLHLFGSFLILDVLIECFFFLMFQITDLFLGFIASTVGSL